MKATELRIGNLITRVYENDSVICEVKGIDETGCYTAPLNTCPPYYNPNIMKSIEPIPITDEWLLKFGFENDIFKASGIIVNRYKIKGICLSIDTRKESEYKYLFFKEDKFIKTVKFIHELQNLYFVLTGKELETK